MNGEGITQGESKIRSPSSAETKRTKTNPGKQRKEGRKEGKVDRGSERAVDRRARETTARHQGEES